MNKIRIEHSDDAMLIIRPRIINSQPFNEIISFQYDKPYVKIVTITRCNDLLFTSLSEIKKILPEFFIQIDKTTIVNLKFAKSVETINGKLVIKLKNIQYIVSRRREKILIDKFRNLFS